MLRPELFDGDAARARSWWRRRSHRLAASHRLATVRYEGFWAPVDTLRDVERLERMAESGTAPWMVWAHEPRPSTVALRTGGAGRPALVRR